MSPDATVTAPKETELDEALQSGLIAGFGDLCAAEHPAVMGGRVGACLFSSFAFPAGLWAVGAVDVTSAALIATVATIVVTRPILLLGGMRIARVLALEIAIGALALSSTFSVIPALLLAVFFPLIGMLACVSALAHVATVRFARDDRPYEADVVVARVTQANVVDIRAAGMARRTSARTQARTGADAAASPTASQQQVK